MTPISEATAAQASASNIRLVDDNFMRSQWSIPVNRSRDSLLTRFGRNTLDDRYLLEGESYQDRFANVARAGGSNEAHAQRIYRYMSKHWFMPATPVLSNMGADRGLPISCFVKETEDSLEGIFNTWNEAGWLAAKGGGIGCVDSETEFLTRKGWVKISEYDGHSEIAVVSEDGKNTSFEKPLKYIEGNAGPMYRIHNSITDMVVSKNHRNFLRFDGKSKFGIKTTEYLLESDRVNRARFQPYSLVNSKKSLNYTDEELRFIVAVAADGYDQVKKDCIRFVFRRTRKIERMKNLAKSLGLHYDLKQEGENTIFLFSSIGLRKKHLTFKNFGDVSLHQCKVIHSELGYWDGSFDNRTGHLKFHTSVQDEVDFIQYVIMNATQKRSSIRSKRNGTEFVVSETGEKHSTAKYIDSFSPKDGKQYCFTTSSGLWLARRNKFMFVTGNSYWGNVRSLGEKIKNGGETSGVIPFITVTNYQSMAVGQGSLRRGSEAAYLPVWHPEIEEFIDIRRVQGGAPERKSPNLHHGIMITDEFMEAVATDSDFDLKSPKDGSVIRTIKARELWIKMITTRLEQGEPYLVFGDTVNQKAPRAYRELGNEVKLSNLCSEITLTTGKDHLGKDRTGVCCLSSVNLTYYDEFKNNQQFFDDIAEFLDNVIEHFIQNAPPEMRKAAYSAMRERSIGIGVMGFHTALQQHNIAFGSPASRHFNIKVFHNINGRLEVASEKLADERGAAPDNADIGLNRRFVHKMAVAPTASISVIAGGASPGIDPITANVYLQKTLSGSFSVKNRELEKLLESKGQNTDKVWSSITTSKGSVQHLDFLTDHEKAVFKTAYELTQTDIVDLAADRADYIDQAQSVNLFLPADVDKSTLNAVHFRAWAKGCKSLYYCRSMSIQRADTVSKKVDVGNILEESNDTSLFGAADANVEATATTSNDDKYAVCESCQ